MFCFVLNLRRLRLIMMEKVFEDIFFKFANEEDDGEDNYDVIIYNHCFLEEFKSVY